MDFEVTEFQAALIAALIAAGAIKSGPTGTGCQTITLAIRAAPASQFSSAARAVTALSSFEVAKLMVSQRASVCTLAS